MAFLRGTRGNDTMQGGFADDYFDGGDGNDVMFGGAGNDTFLGGAGSDTFNGGAGTDTVDYSHTTQAAEPILGIDGVFVSLVDGMGGEAQSIFAPNSTDYYSSIENITGSSYNDMLIGDKGANIIRGLAGTDFIEGMGGADTLDGGDGFDFLTYYHSATRVVVDLQSGTGSAGDAAGDTFSGFEGLIGSAYNDIMSGNSAANDISGGDGNDTINGRGGDDWIEGSAGNDTLIGGSGADTFVYFSHTGTSYSGTDHITDFDVHQDHIRFHAADSENVSLSIANVNTSSFTVSVDITLGNSAHVILDNISIADVGLVMGAIDIV